MYFSLKNILQLYLGHDILFLVAKTNRIYQLLRKNNFLKKLLTANVET